MNTSSSIKNSFVSMLEYLILMIVGFISQKIFINILGIKYLGLNGLFTNIISMLSIVELGMGSAIIYNLYKPLKEHNYNTINSLMKFYKKTYHIIALLVFVIGIILLPILPFIINDVSIDININIIYILFILETSISYIMAYKRSMLYADQKNYIFNIIHIISYLLLNVLQIIYLYLTKDYYGYLIIKIIMRLIENMIVSIYVDNNYKYLRIKSAKDLDKNIYNDIVKKVKALFFHKVSGFIVLGTDNIIISKYLGLVTVGLYSNYYLIINSINRLFSQTIIAITPSVGHLLVDNNYEKNYDVFKKILFINYWISIFTSISILLIIEPFIKIWLGNKFLLPFITLIVLIINYFQKMMRNTFSIFKEAAGIYYEDRFIPIFESITNIVVSIILVNLIGLPGVFIGTVISSLWLWCYSYPKFIYKNILKQSYIKYLIGCIKYILLFIIISTITYFIEDLIVISNILVKIIINMLICLIIPNIIMFLFYKNSNEYIYFKNLLINKLRGKHE